MRRAKALAFVDRGSTVTALYDVVLLDGRPRRMPLRLSAGVQRESTINVDGETWLVADVRRVHRGPAQLICIHPD